MMTSPSNCVYCGIAGGHVVTCPTGLGRSIGHAIALPTEYPDGNPKTSQGMKKPPLGYVPSTAILHEAMAFKDGAQKYGPANWREKGVSSSVYFHAALRHLYAWWEGEENAEDSGAHHLGHARACLAIILDAAAAGKLNDDRPPSVDLSGLMKQYTDKDK